MSVMKNLKYKSADYNEQLLELISQRLPDMLWVKDLEGRYIFANESICDNLLMAEDTQEPLGKQDIFFALREREKFKENPQWHTFGEICYNSDEIVINTNTALRFEEYGHVKGKMLYLDVHKAPYYNESGEIIGTIGTGRDITEQHLIKSELERSVAQLDRTQRIAKVGSWEVDLSTTQTVWSDNNYKIYGVRKEEYKPSFEGLMNFLSPADQENARNAVAEAIESKEVQELSYTITKPDGTQAHLLVRGEVVLDEEGTPISIVGSTLDMTDSIMMQKKLEGQQQLLQFQATHDALTALPNRLLFLDRLEQSMRLAKRSKEKLAILFLDIDHFKEVNDSLGHEVGDALLIEITHRMKLLMRSSDTIARLGGDEFAIVLENFTNIEQIVNIVKKGMEVVHKPFILNQNEVYVGLSVGIAFYPEDGMDSATLLKNADAAMYQAKDDGRNTYRFYNKEMTNKAFQHISIEKELRKALKNEEFEVYYQPQVNSLNSKITGMEALVRWNHPTRGLVFPDDFIPIAEKTNLIVELDRQVMKQAMQQFSLWYSMGLNPGTLSLNLAIKQIESSDFFDVLDSYVDETKCVMSQIAFEVTESQIMVDVLKSIEVLDKIRSFGIEISVDDFGTGYSSLSYLKQLPINKVKIDRSFVKDIPTDNDDMVLTKTIIGLAKNLNLDVIAEGVETKEQLEYLQNNGCNDIQGYYFSKPQKAEYITHLLKEGFSV